MNFVADNKHHSFASIICAMPSASAPVANNYRGSEKDWFSSASYSDWPDGSGKK